MKRLEKYIPLLFLTLCCFLIAIAVYISITLKEFEKTSAELETTYTLINLNNGLLSDVLSIEASVGEFLLVGDDSFLKPYYTSIADIYKRLVAFEKLARSGEERSIIDNFKKLLQAREISTGKVISRHQRNILSIQDEIAFSYIGKRLSEKMKSTVQKINGTELSLLQQRKLANNSSANKFRIIIIILLITIFNIILIAIIIINIQRQKRHLTAELEKSNNLFSSIFENNPASIAISRISDNVILKANNSFIQLMDCSSNDEIIGKSAHDLNMVLESNDADEVAKKIRENHFSENQETLIKTKKGKTKCTSTSVIYFDIDNDPCLFSVSIDITATKNAEEKLMAANRELEAFSYSVSHDLRAPLRAINGYTSILIEDYNTVLDAEGVGYLQSMLKSSKMMGNLIDDLLAFSRLGRTDVPLAEINMNTVVKTVIEEQLNNNTEKYAIKIHELPSIIGQTVLIKQVWVNLISNAIKYSQHKTDSKIEIGSTKKDGLTIFYVKDNGVGFDMQYYNKLFGVFQRLHSKEEFEGTGIGLAIVQKAINRHNGTVWAESKLNEGTTFFFSIPISNNKTI
ncbi:MAG: ATP-binding protein [Bacteroidetes bacterium]|nr:ATP-binding protein [Bacteroidota bacterium]